MARVEEWRGRSRRLSPPACRSSSTSSVSGSVSAKATASSKVMRHTNGGWLSSLGALRMRSGGGGAARGPMMRAAQRSSDPPCGITSAKPERQRGRDRGRSEDQTEGHHHDLVGKAHEGEADRGEQSDDRIADDRLGKAAFARPAADQPGDDRPGRFRRR